MELAILIIGVIAVILLGAVLVLLISLKNKDSGETAELLSRSRDDMGRAIAAVRDENARAVQGVRSEIGRGLERVDSKLAEMTRENYDSRLDLAEKINASLYEIGKANAEQNERISRIVAQSVLSMQQSNEKKLDEMRATVDEKLNATLTTRLNASFTAVSEQLENVYKSLGEMKELSQGVTTNVTALNKVLTNVKARGTWAEVQLEGILDQTIPGMYIKNYSPKGNSEKVEFAVKLPDGTQGGFVYLPVDSKFPMEDYARLCNAAENGDTALVESARKALEDRVLAEAKEITKYISVPATTPFAVLYLATEALYAEIISSKSGIAERVQQMGIMIAGPTTVTALLNSFAMGFKAIAVNEKADEVRVMLSAARAQYRKFGEVLERAKRKIEEAGKSLDDAQKRNDIIQKKLKGVEALDELSAVNAFPELSDIAEADSEE